MQHCISEPQTSLGFSGCSHGCKFEPFQAYHNRRRNVAALAAKRVSREKAGRSSQGPLYIALEADGSDLWRLDPVISMLQEGAVRPTPGISIIMFPDYLAGQHASA